MILVDRETEINRAAWEAQARLALPHDEPQRPGRFELTQYPGHGPGAELLGDVCGRDVLELGCGNGDNLAALAVLGARCTGVDLAVAQVNRAKARWGWLGIPFVHDDARGYLRYHADQVDVVVSIFGVVGLCDPAAVLPLVRHKLRPGGVLLFSVPEESWLAGRRDHIRLGDGTCAPVRRQTGSPGQWTDMVVSCGFDATLVIPVPAPDGTRCCTVVRAEVAQ
ncbi:class I SAM-dependent methyltransferase [Pilimelia columellifera]|uniref:Methyltransferase domain-containing protein n=1 Tax=Pilimelia columellifera subsp. columellifera TaxID=706583 RepID=A0ABN3NMX4_9ACTN